MKIIAYALFGFLLGLFGISIVNQTFEFLALIACVMLIDFLPEKV